MELKQQHRSVDAESRRPIRLQLETGDCPKVLGVAGQKLELVLERGGGNQGAGELQGLVPRHQPVGRPSRVSAPEWDSALESRQLGQSALGIVANLVVADGVN